MTEPPIPVAHRTAAAPNGEMLSRVQQLRLGSGSAGGKGGGGASWLPWVLCLLLAGTWALVGLRSYRAAPREDDAGPAAATNGGPAGAPRPSAGGGPTPAPADKPAEGGTIQLEVKGYLVPAQQIAVSPIDVAGRIVDLNVVEGRFYKEGEVLAQIDPTSFQATYNEAVAAQRSAEERLASAAQKLGELRPDPNPTPGSVRYAELRQVDSQIAEAEAQRARAMDEERRTNSLAGISARELDQAKNDLLAASARVAKFHADRSLIVLGPRPEKIKGAEADVAAATSDVQGASARLAQAKWRLDNCTIRTPVAGTVLAKKAEKGNLVNPLAFAATSGSICDMADLRDLEVDLEIPERDISKLKVGQPCRVRADAFPDRTYTARLDRIMPIANRAKSIVNVRVKVQLPENEPPGTYLKPEMGAVVSFLPMTEKK